MPNGISHTDLTDSQIIYVTQISLISQIFFISQISATLSRSLRIREICEICVTFANRIVRSVRSV